MSAIPAPLLSIFRLGRMALQPSIVAPRLVAHVSSSASVRSPLFPSVAGATTSPASSSSSASSGKASPPDSGRASPSSASSLLGVGGGNRRAAPTSAAGRVSGRTRGTSFVERYKRMGTTELSLKSQQLDLKRELKVSEDYLRQMPRRWEPGDVYSPHDLSSVEMQKWRQRSRRSADIVDALGLSPLDMYKNISLIQDFTTSSGQINGPDITGLRPVNQRKIAKMIRRAQGMGLYPRLHDHPEVLRHAFSAHSKN